LDASPDFNLIEHEGTEVIYSVGSDCSKYYSSLPTLTYVIDYAEFVIPPQAYTYSQPNTKDALFPNLGQICLIEMFPWDQEFTIFGGPFFNQYAVQFNYEKMTIGFATNTNAASDIKLKEKVDGLGITLICISAFMVFCLILVLVRCRKSAN